ncbi:MAG: class I SAM-dependent methyltransferase [Caldilineaceae bacterium]
MLELTFGTWRFAIERTQPTQTELVTLYNQVAPSWHNAVHRLGYDQAYAHLFDRLQSEQRLPLPQAAQVLDCGIGTGMLSLALHQVSGQPLQLHGIDISPQMLHVARDLFQQAGVTAQLDCRDTHHLLYPANHFNLVMCAHMLEHVADPAAVLAEMTRVLRPGAPLLVIITANSLFDTLLRFKYRHAHLCPAQIADWMRTAGLQEVRFYELKTGSLWRQGHSIACWGRKASDDCQ